MVRAADLEAGGARPAGPDRAAHLDVGAPQGPVLLAVGHQGHRRGGHAAAEGAFERISDSALEEGPATLVLDAPGDYPFYCSIHGGATFGQTGYVVVAGT